MSNEEISKCAVVSAMQPFPPSPPKILLKCTLLISALGVENVVFAESALNMSTVKVQCVRLYSV